MADINKGVAPVNVATPVGLTRTAIGDTLADPLEPAEAGYGDYRYFSDAEIEGFLVLGGTSYLRAAGWAYRQLAASYTIEGSSISTDDLRIDTTKRGGDLASIAKSFFDEADKADEVATAGEFHFEIVPLNRCRPRGW